MTHTNNNRCRESQSESSRPGASGFDSLPPEVFYQIIGEVTSRKDLSSLSRSSSGIYWATSDILFARAYDKQVLLQGGVEDATTSLFIHAVKHDSKRLLQWLMFREHGSQLRGLFPWMKGFTYLHYALLQDAPKVAIQLLKHGSDLNEDAALYPDLKSLYIAIARPLRNRIGALDGPLRIACSYALPRTAEYLLVRGADPNAHSDFGLAAIHMSVRQRLPWSLFELFSVLNKVGDKESEGVGEGKGPEVARQRQRYPRNAAERIRPKRSKGFRKSQNAREEDANILGDRDPPEKDSGVNIWEAKVLRTVQVLLRFGADCNLLALNSRHHQCSHECWKSLSCVPAEQRVLHIAAASGYSSVVSALVRRKARVFQTDGQGNLPVVHAMAQGHDDTVAFLLQSMKFYGRKRSGVRCFNPIVCVSTRSTALHMACRFGYYTVVGDLLKGGADVNGVDSLGRTPLHEAVGQRAPDLEDRLVETLYLLSENNASQEAIDHNGRRAGDMGAGHRLSGVRALFQYATMARYDWQRLTEPQGGGRENIMNSVSDPSSSTWYVEEEPQIPPPVRHYVAPAKAPVWVKKGGLQIDKDLGLQPKVTEDASNKENSACNSRMTHTLPDTVESANLAEKGENEEKKKKKSGGRKKWARISLQ